MCANTYTVVLVHVYVHHSLVHMQNVDDFQVSTTGTIHVFKIDDDDKNIRVYCHFGTLTHTRAYTRQNCH